MGSIWNIVFAFGLLLIWMIAGVFITDASVKLGSYKDVDNYFNNAYWYAFWAAFITWFLVILVFIIIVTIIILGLLGFAVLTVGTGGTADAAIVGGTAAAVGTEVAVDAGIGAAAAVGTEVAIGTLGATEVATTGTQTALNAAANLSDVTKVVKKRGTISKTIYIGTLVFLGIALALTITTGVLSALTARSMIESPNFIPSDPDLNSAYINSIVSACLNLGAAGLIVVGFIAYYILYNKRQTPKPPKKSKTKSK